MLGRRDRGRGPLGGGWQLQEDSRLAEDPAPGDRSAAASLPSKSSFLGPAPLQSPGSTLPPSGIPCLSANPSFVWKEPGSTDWQMQVPQGTPSPGGGRSRHCSETHPGHTTSAPSVATLGVRPPASLVWTLAAAPVATCSVPTHHGPVVRARCHSVLNLTSS